MDAHSHVIQVIETTYTKGDGTKENPVRRVKAYFDFEGNMICEHDEFQEYMAIREGKKDDNVSKDK